MKSILLVENDGAVREPLVVALGAAGYEVAPAATAAEAIRALAARKPDAVILDPVLPDTPGLTFLARLRRTKGLERLPILIVAANAPRPMVLAAARLGVRSYIIRSRFSMADLLQRLGAELSPCQNKGPPAPPTDSTTAAAPCPARPCSAPPDHVEALRSLEPIIKREELLALIKKGGELQAFSPTVGMVINLTANPGCAIEAVAKAISQDHAVAVKILKLANSVAFTRGEPADSVRKAVVRIGLGRIRQAVLNIGVVERFSAPAFKDELSTAAFWEHAIGCAIIAAGLASLDNSDLADRAFTSGLLHDVGRVILAEQLGDRYVRVIRAARQLRLPLEQVESRMLQLNHADVMEPILKAWNCRDLVRPIICHHLSLGTARVADPDLRREVARLSLANRLAHALMLGTSGNETLYPTHELCRELGLDGAKVRTITSEARTHTDDMKLTLLSHSNSAPWPDQARKLRETLRVPFRPRFIGPSPDTDSHAIFCKELAGPQTETDPPTIAIIHAASAEGAGNLAEQLKSADADANTRLPVIALSPGAKEVLDPELLSGRRSAVLPATLALARFIETVNHLLDTRPPS